MKYILIVFALFWAFLAGAQTQPPIVQGSKLYRFVNGIKPDSALFLPRRDTLHTDSTMIAPGQLMYRLADSLLYYRKGDAMVSLAASSGIGAVPSTRTLTFNAGTGIGVTGGTQDLSADRTWTITNTLSTGLQSANTVFAGPPTGVPAVPSFRALQPQDIPFLDASRITSGVFPIARGGTGLGVLGTANQLLRVNAGATALEYFTPSFVPSGAPNNINWNAFNGTTIASFNESNANAPTATSYFGLNMPSVTNNFGAQLAFRAGTGYFRTLETGVYGSWLQIADRTWANSTFAPLSGSGNYIQNQSAIAQVGNFHLTAAGYTQTNFTVYKAGSAGLNGFIRMTTDVPGTRGAQLQLTEGVDPGLATWTHNGTDWIEAMRVTASGDVGIGVVPSSKLHVSGNGLFVSANNTITARSVTTGDATLSLDVSGISNTSIKTFRTGGRTGIINNANEAISILTTGNVGIGTTTPQGLLHINTANTLGLYIQNTQALSASSGAFVRMYNSGTPTAANQRLGGLLFGTNPTGTTFRAGAQIDVWSDGAWTDNVSHPTHIRFNTTPSGSTGTPERMRITAAGGVGIGTTTPAFEGLHLLKTNAAIIAQSSTAYSSVSGGLFEAYNSGTPSAANQRLGSLIFGSIPTGTTVRPSAQIDGISGAAWTDGVSQPSYLSFLTTPSGTTDPMEGMRLTQDGDLGIGKVPSLGMLDVAGAGNFGGSLGIGDGAASITGLGSASFTSLAVSGVTTLSGGLNANTVTSPSIITTGEFRAPIRTTAISTSLTATDHTLRATASGITLTLPAASTCNGRIYVLMNYASGGNQTTSAVLVNGVSTTTLPTGVTWWIQSDGTNWYKIN